MGLDYEMQITMSGVLNICQVVACLWSLWGMDRFGRRKLLLGGGICMVSINISANVNTETDETSSSLLTLSSPSSSACTTILGQHIQQQLGLPWPSCSSSC